MGKWIIMGVLAGLDKAQKRDLTVKAESNQICWGCHECVRVIASEGGETTPDTHVNSLPSCCCCWTGCCVAARKAGVSCADTPR